VGLSLQSIAGAVGNEGLGERLSAAISDLDDTIRQVRSAIYELGSAGVEPGLRARVQSLGRELELVVGFGLDVSFDGPVDSAISEKIAEHILPAIREAVTNIGRHAQATHANVRISVRNGLCVLRVTDDGQGIYASDKSHRGFGLGSLQRRAEKLGGTLAVDNLESGGTQVTWQVPITQ
jgi:two-component system sensor histidine kinase DevS